jgi:hypothetical protein
LRSACTRASRFVAQRRATRRRRHLRGPRSSAWRCRAGVCVRSRGRPVPTVATTIAVAVAQTCLCPTARGRSEALLSHAGNAQSIGGRLRRCRAGGSTVRSDGRRALARELARGVSASHDHLPNPFDALVARSGAGGPRRGADAHGLDRGSRGLDHLIATRADFIRLVTAMGDRLLAADPVDLVAR